MSDDRSCWFLSLEILAELKKIVKEKYTDINCRKQAKN